MTIMWEYIYVYFEPLPTYAHTYTRSYIDSNYTKIQATIIMIITLTTNACVIYIYIYIYKHILFLSLLKEDIKRQP